MHVREYTDGDLDALRAIHAAQGFDYALPDLRNPLFVTKLVLQDSNVAPPLGAASPGFPPGRDARTSGAQSTQPCHSERMPDEIGRQSRNLSSSHNDEAMIDLGAGSCLPAARHGRILGAALLRLTTEAYLLLDPRAGTPRERWQWLLALHEAARRDAWQRGLEDVHAWLPPPIAAKFGRRLARLGWRRDDSWTPYCLRLGC